MTADTRSSAAESPILTLPVVAGVVAAMALLKLIVGSRIELAFDEGYYTFWSFYLQVGYLDHPPAVAWMIAMGRAVFGDTELGARVLAVLSGVAVSAMIYRIGILLFGQKTAALATIWYNLTLAFGLGFVITPDPPSALFWAAVLWVVAEFIEGHDPVWLLLGGVFAGLGLWAKYTNAFLLIGLLLFILVSSDRRRWFGLWQLWAAPVLALLVFSPVIVWNAQRDWASFLFQGRRTSVAGLDPNWPANLGELLAGQALFMVPVLFICAIVGMAMLARHPRDPARAGLALPVLTALPALAYFLFHAFHGRVEANWLLPIWSGLTLVAAWAALKLRPASGARLVVWRVLIWGQGVAGVLMIAVVMAQFLFQPLAGSGLFDRTQETRGWRPLATRLDAIAEAHRAGWVLGQTHYAASGEIATYLRFTGSRLPYYPLIERQRYEFLPPLDPGAMGWPALVVEHAGMATDLAAWFGNVEAVETLQRTYGSERMEAYSVYVVSEPTDAFLELVAGQR